MPAMDFQPVLAAFVFSLACLGILLSPLGRRLLLDRPNQRSLHVQPVPRSGGIAIAAGAAAGVCLAADQALAAFGLAAALAALSLVDDLMPLPTLLRLAGHLAAAAGFVALIVGGQDIVLFAVLTLAIAWFANLYNFMDGSDGLAGGMAVIAHPDDESELAVTLYKIAKEQNGRVDLFVITNGEAGFKYSILAEAYYHCKLTDEKEGRRRLPGIRRQELIKAGSILGISHYFFANQRDDKYCTDERDPLDSCWNVKATKATLHKVLA